MGHFSNRLQRVEVEVRRNYPGHVILMSWRKVGNLRQCLLSGDDKVRLAPLEHHPGGGLHPDPGAALGEQPEDAEATFAGF